jgi:negative regulator of flagellin synthesis FlgM
VKIDSANTQIPALNQGTQRAPQNDAQQSDTTVPTAGSSTSTSPAVSLSAVSSGLRTSSTADVDTAQVASIKAALANGSYTADSGKIADGMLGSARDLMQKTPPTGG